jgi:lipopolysaccharide export system protein LptC
MFQRFWATKAAPLMVAAAIAAAPGCRPAEPGEAEEVVPELNFEGVSFRVYRDGDLRAFGQAETASLRRDTGEIRARDLVATLPRPAGAVRITAPAGQGVLRTRTFSASGGISVSRGSDVARTERARFVSDGPEGRIEGDAPVVVEGEAYRLEGTGFTLDPATGELAIRGGTRLVAGEGARR